MIPFLQCIISGLLMGGVYALVSVGLTLIFGIVELVNFSHADYLMVAMYIVYCLFTYLKMLGDCIAVRCDVTQADQIGELFRQVEDAFGGVDILVNNAGVLKPKPIEEMTEADWDTGMAVNLKSIFLCTRQAIGPLRKRGGGVIINASSFAAVIPSVGQSVYAAAKLGVRSFTQVSAAELAPYNIRLHPRRHQHPSHPASHRGSRQRGEDEK